MLTRWFPSFLVGAVIILFIGCDSTENVDELQYVVEGYLAANELLTPIYLSRSQPVNERFDFTAAIVDDASIRVEQLNSSGAVVESYPYTFNASNNAYEPLASHVVVPETDYRVRIDVSGEVITSTTRIPGAFDLVSVNTNTVTYQGPVQYETTVSESAYPGRQSIYVFSIAADEVSLDNLVPLVAEFIDGDESELPELRVVESPPLNEANFTDNMDGTYSVKLPWLAVAFFGENTVTVNAIDDNLYDFIRSNDIQQGGSTFAPGEIPNVIDRVDGGTGVFGSFARVSSVVQINR